MPNTRTLIISMLTLITIGTSQASPPSTIKYTYNEAGQVIAIDGSINRRYHYDLNGNMTYMAYAPNDAFIFRNFNEFGQPRSIDNAGGGYAKQINYSPEGRVINIQSYNPTTTKAIEYNNTGDITKISHADGTFLKYTYDNARRLSLIENALGEKIHFAMNAAGDITTTALINSNNVADGIFRKSYDELSRPITQQTSENTFTRNRYDAAGNLIEQTDAAGNKTNKSVDPFGSTIKVTSPSGRTTGISRDKRGEVESITDPRGIQTSFIRDYQGRITGLISPDSGSQNYSYDKLGNIASHKDAMGNLTTFEYDAQGLLTGKKHSRYPDSNLVITHDPKSGLKEVSSKHIQEKYFSLDREHLISKSYSVPTLSGGKLNLKTNFRYDTAGRAAGWSSEQNDSIHFTRDKGGKISEINYMLDGKTYNIAKNIKHLPYGPVSQATFGNGEKMTRIYNKSYQMIGLTGRFGLGFGYDKSGNIKNSLSRNYTYDKDGQISKEVRNDESINYTYDASGNRILTQTIRRNTISKEQRLAFAPNSNRLISINGSTVQSDANGNLTSINNGLLYTYGPNNQLAEIHRAPDDMASKYYYNSLGQRTTAFDRAQGASTSKAINYRYDQDERLIGVEEHSNIGMVRMTRWVWIDDLPIAQVTVNMLNDGNKNVSIFYIYSDPLNTPRAATDRNNNIVWRWDSDAYGYTAPHSLPHADSGAPAFIPLRFPGQTSTFAPFADLEDSLYYNYFRDYNPELGRYMQSDPIGLDGGLNVYTYANGNPASFVDFYGLALSGQGTSRASKGGFPQSAWENRAGPRPDPLVQRMVERAATIAAQQGVKHIIDSIAPGSGSLLRTSTGFASRFFMFASLMTHSPGLGGCLDGICSDTRKDTPKQCTP